MEILSNTSFPGFFPPKLSNDNGKLPFQLSVIDPELLKKQTDFQLGQFLVECDLIPEQTLKASLNLQAMVIDRLITRDQAAEALKQLHLHGPSADMTKLIKGFNSHPQTIFQNPNYPLLGDILVKAGILSKATLQTAIKLQEIVRSGALSQDDARQALNIEIVRASIKKNRNDKAPSLRGQKITELLLQSGLITEEEQESAYESQKESGDSIGHILVSTGKINANTYIAATECEQLLSQQKIRLEHVIISLHYCQRTGLGLPEAINELGWHDLSL